MLKTFDSKCFDLAEHFLEDEPAEFHLDPQVTVRLAAHIQLAIEEWLEFERRHPGEA
jgi:hypothetical protein